MEEEPTATRLEGSDRRARSAGNTAALAIAFIALALVKPWALGAPSQAPAGTTTPAPSPRTAPASPGPTIRLVADPNAMACLASTGVELLSLVRWPGHEVRTWQPTTGAIGDDPLDPGLVPVAIFSSHVLGLGLCEEASGAAGPATAAANVLDVVSLVGADRIRKDLGNPIQITLPQTSADFAVLYGPRTGAVAVAPSGGPGGPTEPTPSGPGASSLLAPEPGFGPASETGATATWAPGTYALSFVFGEKSATRVQWLVFEISAVAGEPD